MLPNWFIKGLVVCYTGCGCVLHGLWIRAAFGPGSVQHVLWMCATRFVDACNTVCGCVQHGLWMRAAFGPGSVQHVLWMRATRFVDACSLWEGIVSRIRVFCRVPTCQ